MSILKTLRLPQSETVSIDLNWSGGDENVLTFLLGANGTGKSRVLRSVLNTSIELVSGEPGTKNVERVNFRCVPSKVLAISATTNDRFPAKSGFNEKNIGKFGADAYEYIGPRTSRNLISRRSGFEVFVRSVLRKKELSKVQADFINRLSNKTSVSTRIKVSIGLPPTSPGSRSKAPLELRADSYVQSLLSSEFNGDFVGVSDYQKALRLRSFVNELSLRVGNSTRKRDLYTIFIDLREGLSVDASEGVDVDVVELGLRLGFLRIVDITFQGSGRQRDRMAPDDFSAGQWGLFSSLATLSLSAEDGSLILIDEPETGLHPAWQREFIDDLIEALGGRRRCHVLLATHSSMIVGGSRFGSEVVVLRADNEKGNSMEFAQSPLGWSANDLLEDVFELDSSRSPEIELLVSEALDLISLGLGDGGERLKRVSDKLDVFLHTLPLEDELRTVISTVGRLARQNVEG